VPLSVSIIVPTRGRPGYLDVALASIAPQAAAADAELLVVEDGRAGESGAVAARHGARYVSLGGPRGLNAARNAGLRAASGELLIYVDDDVAVGEGWLAALIAAADALPEAGVFTGPIRARFEGRALRMCGREGPPITSLDLGPADSDAPHAWGANMAIRRSAFDAVGEFDARRSGGGDEEEWQRRHLAAGGRIRYIAAAALDHRRAGADARLPALMRAAFRRGVEVRRFDEEDGSAPALARELRTLAGCLWHVVRRRCENGFVMAAHSAGRVIGALGRRRPPADDCLSGESGTVGGRRDVLRSLGDRALDALARPGARGLARATTTADRRRVLVLSIARPELQATFDAALSELRASRHDLTLAVREPGALGKFENLNELLAGHPPDGHDWLLLLDDDVELPPGFLDRFLYLAERHELALAQPAHRLRSHAAWRLTRRHPASLVRETAFVEIGPVTALHRATFDVLLPFPPLRMGWGLDAHWSALAREHGWRLGVVDATPIAHRLRPAGAGYSREQAIAEARVFLAAHPYLPASESQRTLATHRRCA
jgi:GT2 family glycosyltransferase